MKEKYIPGEGCQCSARCSCECGCDVDWTPREVYDLREQRDRLAEEIEQLKSQLTQTRGAVTISRNGYVQELEQQRDEARGIVLACHRAFIGGSDFCQSEARRLSADLVRKISLPNVTTQAPL